ncbi:MAG: hypothetical protein ACHRXM_20010 [Isosphaerales bacterium]
MKTTLRWCLRLTFVASLGLLLGLLVGVERKGGSASLRFEPSPLVIPGVMQSGKEYYRDAEVVNESARPARIIGTADNCTRSGCYSGRGVPTVIPAWGRGRVTVHIQAGVPGDLSGELTFYTDRRSQPTLVIKLTGTIREGEPHDARAHAANPRD